MKLIDWKAIVEGLLFAAGDEGLTLKQMATVLEINESTVLDIVGELKDGYSQPGRGINLVEVAGTYQLTTKKDHAGYLKK
ncbi:SMC-Scp complex subunit ScpB, partial [Bacillus sp. JJ1521]|uniref:SMC-Scp complex subunit ScpB n=1 Tax=Bacillus sp. JJ1521 TaxID=3122957 RepID=UPI002FFEC2EB